MYQPYPGGDQSPQQYGQPGGPALATPPPVTRAAQLMYVGAAASLIGIVVNLTTVSALKSAILKRSPNLSPAQVNSAEHVEIILLVVAGLIGIVLWLWMAQMNKAGKNWARITSTVFFALDTLGAIGGLAGGALSGGSVNRFYGLVVWVIGVAAILLLWQRSSTQYFKSVPR